MKKTVLILLLVLSIFSLTACDPAHFNYNYETLKNNVIKVELIIYNNSNNRELFNKRDQVLPFDFEKMEVKEVLKADKKEDCLLDFSKILFLEYWKHSDSPKGTCLRIIFENGEFEIVSFEVVYAGRFDSEGNVKTFIGGLANSNSLKNLINKYFIIQV